MKSTESQKRNERRPMPLSLCPERLGLLSTLALSLVSLGGLIVLLGGVATMVIQTRRIESTTDMAVLRTETRQLDRELASLDRRLTGLWDVLLEARAVIQGQTLEAGSLGAPWSSVFRAPAEESFGESWDIPVDRIDETLRQAREVSECFEEVLVRMEGNAEAWAGLPSIQPVRGAELSSRFGLRTDPFTRRLGWHQGLDFAAGHGTPVRATGAGLVLRAGWYGNYGQLVEIDHGNGLVTRYGHLSRILVKMGDRVSREDEIGRVGSTGRSNAAHLHYEVHVFGQPVNPEPYILNHALLASTGSVTPGVPSAPRGE